MKQFNPPRRYTQPMGAQEGVLNSEEAGPPRHRHSTPSDGDEVAAAVDQQSDDSDCTEDPEVFFRGEQVTDQTDTTSATWTLIGGNYCCFTTTTTTTTTTHPPAPHTIWLPQ